MPRAALPSRRPRLSPLRVHLLPCPLTKPSWTEPRPMYNNTEFWLLVSTQANAPKNRKPGARNLEHLEHLQPSASACEPVGALKSSPQHRNTASVGALPSLIQHFEERAERGGDGCQVGLEEIAAFVFPDDDGGIDGVLAEVEAD